MILNFFVSRYLKVVTEFLEGEICKVLGVKKEIKSLTENLVKIRCLIQDAERKRRGSAVIDNWVRMLKDLMYDADDIIDLCTIEGGKLLEAPPASASAVSSPLGFVSSSFKCTKYRHEIATKIEALNARLKEMAEFNALVPEIVSASQEPQPHKTTTRETSPLEVEEDIVGEQIEVAAHNLIDAMLQKNKQKCRVFGIVGMGGIGKTTLARQIYNDQRIKDNFPISKWLYASKEYSEIDLLKELVRCAAEGAESFRGESRSELEPKLASLLTKNLFLVLDDVWSATVWNDFLRRPLSKGEGSCTILVTTRKESVLIGIRRSYIHQVEKMDENSGWMLLRKIVFEAGEEDDMRR